MEEGIFVGGGGPGNRVPQRLALRYANRHGLIAGATGSGKTVTLQILAEGFSRAGVPVVLSDVKGDLAGLSRPGSERFRLHGAFAERAAQIGLEDYCYAACPVTFWDVFGEQGHPVRATLAEMGPMLLARMLDLSAAQEGVLAIAFRVADEQGLPLLDLADLRALLVWLGENRAALSLRFGHVAPASVAAIQRRLLMLEAEGAEAFFGEPALEIGDLMRRSPDGHGQVNIIAADRLMAAPRLYATFLLWLLSELFEELPEVGDPERPKLVFFFDEAHLLFDDAPRALLDAVEQVARLIRSKGVGVYFVTQTPDDVPEDVLGQLGNRVQHALRAFTARDRAALREAARTYRDNPAFDTETAIREVGVGEAVTSFLGAKGVPGMVERTLIRPPSSQLGLIAEAERRAILQASDMAAKYDTPVDRRSAAEMLAGRTRAVAAEAERSPPAPASRRYGGRHSPGPAPRRADPDPASPDLIGDIGRSLAGALVRELGGTTGRRLVRGVLGGLFRGR
ncbi:helicase HerA-like domain-containing protein [Roseivivax sp. CAU 1761]